MTPRRIGELAGYGVGLLVVAVVVIVAVLLALWAVREAAEVLL